MYFHLNIIFQKFECSIVLVISNEYKYCINYQMNIVQILFDYFYLK